MTDERRDHNLGMAGTLDAPASDRVAPSTEHGSTSGHFVLRKRLGAGGMGVVYAGEDVDLRRPVAIKLVRGAAQHPHGDPRYQAALAALIDGTGFRLDCVKCPAPP